MTLSEFTAVVLAGGDGGSFYPLVENKPKCLLPIGNVPMIFYTLKYIQKEGFEDVYIVTRSEWKPLIEHEVAKTFLKHDSQFSLKLVLNFITFETANYTGTGKLLSLIKNNIPVSLNVVIFGGDMIGEIDSLCGLINLHRKNDAILSIFTSEAVKISENSSNKNSKTVEVSKKCLNSIDVIGFDPDCERLLYMMNQNEIEEFFSINPLIFFRYPSIKFRRDLHDLHIYCIRYSLLDSIIQANVNADSLRVDVIPKVISEQFELNEEVDVEPYNMENVQDTCIDTIINDFNIGNDAPVGSYNGFGIPQTFKDIKYKKCFIYVNKSQNPVYRVNTMSAYIKANSEIYEKQAMYLMEENSKKEGKKNAAERFLITNLDKTSRVSDNCVIRYSNISNNCLIDEKSKLTKTTLFENVSIGKNCRLDNCIVANGAKINDNCVLTRCIIGPDEVVFANSKFTDQTLFGSSNLFDED